jgi:hypothetical protein
MLGRVIFRLIVAVCYVLGKCVVCYLVGLHEVSLLIRVYAIPHVR